MNKARPRNFSILLLLLLHFSVYTQNDTTFKVKLPETKEKYRERPSQDIDRFWKYHRGDDIKWADPAFDDKKWQLLDPRLKVKDLKPGLFENIGWFRIHLDVDTAILNTTVALMLAQDGASEIYLDGKLIHRFGKVHPKNPDKEERYNPLFLPFDIRFEDSARHVLAIRYSNCDAIANDEDGTIGFYMKLGHFSKNITWHYINSTITTIIFVFYFTFFLALGFLHLTLFLYYKANRSNLYYSIFAFTFGTTFLCIVIQQSYLDPDTAGTFEYIMTFLSNFYEPALLAMLYSIFLKKIPKLFWIWLVAFLIEFMSNISGFFEIPYYGILLTLAFVIESFRMIIVSIVKKREGAWIIGSGIIFTVAFFALYVILALMGHAEFFNTQEGILGIFVLIFVVYATLSIPASMTIYLARDFARTSKNLEKKLVEVEDLSAKSLEQEKEKQQILANQNVVLEQQVKERTLEISHQKEIIEEKNKDITDSINYAKRIQDATLTAKEVKHRIFPNAFVLFKPKDIVSGDFYWFGEKNGSKLIAACDCTGHGVPGALMSMIGNNVLNQLVNERGLTEPDAILNELHEEVRKTLKQGEDNSTKDGMDVAMLSFMSPTEVEYAGAQRPLWVIRNGQLEETKATKISIGGQALEDGVKFIKHSFTFQSGDLLYIFSDGYADQFNNQEKKLMTRKFKEILLSIQHLSMPEQEKYLDDFIENWKGNLEQTDDILVIGIRIS